MEPCVAAKDLDMFFFLFVPCGISGAPIHSFQINNGAAEDVNEDTEKWCI